MRYSKKIDKQTLAINDSNVYLNGVNGNKTILLTEIAKVEPTSKGITLYNQKRSKSLFISNAFENFDVIKDMLIIIAKGNVEN